MNYRMQICQSIGEIAQADWNSLLLHSNNGLMHPALRHEYLLALEQQGCATAETGWAGLHLAIQDETDQTVAAMPLYLKSHSYGEYVFDWSWAQAYERSGLPYYPKLLSAIPFTPILGPKVLSFNQEASQALRQGLETICVKAAQSDDLLGTEVSTAHLLFLTEADQALLLSEKQQLEFMPRSVVQFHWENLNPNTSKKYVDFEEYLAGLQQKKRKNIRAERRKALQGGVEIKRYTGAEIAQEDLEFFYRCYERTYAEHFSTPYLSLGFFEQIVQTMGEQIMLAVAELEGRRVASSFFLFNEDRLYGRYWGCTERIDCLHFELCYYQAIEFAIEKGIHWFEGGAQGEHKMARGLNPETMTSAHWVAHPSFQEAIERFLERERSGLAHYEGELGEHTAYKKARTLPGL